MLERLQPDLAVPSLALALALAAVLAPPAVASDATPPAQDPEIPAETPSLDAVFGDSIRVRVINIEVVVTDRKGDRVVDLAPDDLRLLVDGEEVGYEYFTEVRGGVAVGSEERGLGGPAAEPIVSGGEAAATSYLVFVDDLLTLGRDRNRVVRALAESLDFLRPGDRMAVVAYGYEGLELLSPWTASKSELRRVLHQVEERPAKGLLRFAAYRPPNGPGQGAIGRGELRLASREVDDPQADDSFREAVGDRPGPREEAWLTRTVAAAAASMRAFGDPRGRQVMLMLAGGWHLAPALAHDGSRASPLVDPYRITRIFGPLADTANLLGYTIYPIDVPGEVSTFGADVARSTSSNASPFLVNRALDNNLRYIAELTGGTAMLDGARLHAFPAIAEDTASYYWLGFIPHRSFDDRPHRVKVEATRPGLRVRTRRSYRDLSPRTQRTLLVESALLFDDLPATSPLAVTVGPPVSERRRSMRVPLEISIPLSEVTALPSGDDWWVQLEVMMAVEDDRGRRSSVIAVPIGLRRDSEPQSGQRALYRTTIEVRRRPHHLVVAVHDPLENDSLFARAELYP